MNSNKINLNQEIEMKNTQNRVYRNQFDECLKASNAVKKTYLHIAARSRVFDILKLVVEIDAIDINTADELGETTLFEVCKFNRLKSIKYLVSLNTVDLNHCINDGDDALKVSMNLLDKKTDFEIINREDYIKALLLIFKRDQDYFD